MNAHLVFIMGKLEYKETGIISSFNGLELVELTNDIHYVFKYDNKENLFTITVPKGFVTDFGTVPKWAQCMINPKGNGTLAYIVHDWLCITNIYSRRTTDNLLYSALEYCDVSFNKRVITYTAVRVYAIISKRLLDTHIKSAMDILDEITDSEGILDETYKTKKTD